MAAYNRSVAEDSGGPMREQRHAVRRRNHPYRTTSLDDTDNILGLEESRAIRPLELERCALSDIPHCEDLGEEVRRTTSVGAASAATTVRATEESFSTMATEPASENADDSFSPKLKGLPMQRTGVSGLLDDVTLDTGQESFDAFIDEALRREGHSLPAASEATASPTGERPVASGAAMSHEPAPPPLLRRPSSSSFRRSKGEALVHATLGSLATGSARDAGGRPSMYDECRSYRHSSLSGEISLALLGVYNGHGGHHASRYLKDHLHRAVLGHLGLDIPGSDGVNFDDAAARYALASGLETCEKELQASACTVRTSAAVVMLQEGGSSLNVAWCGDCGAVLSREGRAVKLTAKRVGSPLKHNGTSHVATLGRSDLSGACSMEDVQSRSTRSDAEGSSSSSSSSDAAERRQRKLPGLSEQPQLASEALTSEDEFVVIASNGLWDVLSPQEAVTIARNEIIAYEDARLTAEKLVQTALRRKTRDNITVLVARLFAPRPEESMARHIERSSGQKSIGQRSNSFVKLPTPPTFVQVIGGFDGLEAK